MPFQWDDSNRKRYLGMLVGKFLLTYERFKSRLCSQEVRAR